MEGKDRIWFLMETSFIKEYKMQDNPNLGNFHLKPSFCKLKRTVSASLRNPPASVPHSIRCPKSDQKCFRYHRFCSLQLVK